MATLAARIGDLATAIRDKFNLVTTALAGKASTGPVGASGLTTGTSTILGRTSGGTGAVEALTVAQARAALGLPVRPATAASGSLTPDSSSFDHFARTALAANLTINADVGSPADGQRMMIRLRDDGTARTISWTTGAAKAFRAVGVTLPTTTVPNKVLYIGCVYNLNVQRWDIVAVAQEA